MLNISNASHIKILSPKLNKALETVLAEASSKELDTLNTNSDLKSVINSLLKQSLDNPDTKKTLLELVKNNTTLKNLGSVTTTIKDILTTIKDDTDSSSTLKQLKNFLSDIKELKPNGLKTKIQNSGVFLESKLANHKESINDDLRTILGKLSLEMKDNPKNEQIQKHIDKVLLQIDNYQLISSLSNSSSFYVPYLWEDLEEGDVAIKRLKDDSFFCDINLKLKDYGEIDLRVMLFEKNKININIFAQNKKFQQLIKVNLKELRRVLFSLKISPQDIRVIEPKVQEHIYLSASIDIKMGFEVKV